MENRQRRLAHARRLRQFDQSGAGWSADPGHFRRQSQHRGWRQIHAQILIAAVFDLEAGIVGRLGSGGLKMLVVVDATRAVVQFP